MLDKLCQSHALRSLDWQMKCSVPDQLGERAQRAAHAKYHGVKLGVANAVVVEKHTRYSVDIGERIFALFFFPREENEW